MKLPIRKVKEENREIVDTPERTEFELDSLHEFMQWYGEILPGEFEENMRILKLQRYILEKIVAASKL